MPAQDEVSNKFGAANIREEVQSWADRCLRSRGRREG